jgi:hypoxanthine phosphoribosyltransferase
MLSEEKIKERVGQLGAQITQAYQGEEIILVGILRGSFIFYSDLVRQINLPVHCEFMGISSYGDATKSSGVVQITSDLTLSIADKHVLIIEDIIDTGLTMSYLLKNLSTRHPKSLKNCTLLHKPGGMKVDVPIDYAGFRIENEFVIGYGLDYTGLYRNLPFIGVYRGAR